MSAVGDPGGQSRANGDNFGSGIDSKWHGLYRTGGLALIGVGITYVVCLWLTVRGYAGNSSGNALTFFQSIHGNIAQNALLWVTYIVGDLFFIPALLALYFLLRHQSRTLLLVGLGLTAAYVVFDMGITEPNWLALTNLANGYYGTVNPVSQSADLAAGQYALALLPMVNAMSYFISAAGLFLVNLVLFRGVVRRTTAWFGVPTMALAFAGGFSWFFPVLGIVFLPGSITFALWNILLGVQVYKIGVKQRELALMTAEPRADPRVRSPVAKPG